MPLSIDQRISVISIAAAAASSGYDILQLSKSLLELAEGPVTDGAAKLPAADKPARKARTPAEIPAVRDPEPVQTAAAVETVPAQAVVETPPKPAETSPPPKTESAAVASTVSEKEIHDLIATLAKNAAAGGSTKTRQILAECGGAVNRSTLKPEFYAKAKQLIEAALSASV